MSARGEPLASAATRAWVRMYSLGLPEAVRLERGDEIASDIWEHAADSTLDGRNPAPEILTRCLLGVPSDLVWRVEHSQLSRAPSLLATPLLGVLARGEAVARWLGRRGLPGLAGSCAVLVALVGALVVITAPANGTPETTRGELTAIGVVVLAMAAAIGTGSRVVNRRPRLGAALLIAGAAPAGLLLWQTVVGPLAAAAVCWGAVRRWRSGSTRGEPAPPLA